VDKKFSTGTAGEIERVNGVNISTSKKRTHHGLINSRVYPYQRGGVSMTGLCEVKGKAISSEKGRAHLWVSTRRENGAEGESGKREGSKI